MAQGGKEGTRIVVCLLLRLLGPLFWNDDDPDGSGGNGSRSSLDEGSRLKGTGLSSIDWKGRGQRVAMVDRSMVCGGSSNRFVCVHRLEVCGGQASGGVSALPR